jgi:hypothetical protein
VNRLGLRLAAFIVIVFAVGFIAGQFSMSLTVKHEAEARRLTLIEGTLQQNQDLSQLEQLRALGYVDGTRDPQAEIRGVVVHDPERTSPGVNLYGSRIRPSALLIDNEGRELHRWAYPGDDGWEHTELLADGSLLVVVNQREVFKLDRDSELLWRHETDAHHDLAVDSSGDIYLLSDEERLRPEIHPEVPVVEDFVEVLDADGRLKDRFSILDALRSSRYAHLLVSPQHLPSDRKQGDHLTLDLLHTNHIEIFDGALAHRSELFREGLALISMRTINTIAIIDPASRELLWAWGPTNLYRQHHPTLLDNGNILVFNNGHERSQVVEVDPLTYRVVWRYAPRHGFLSRYRGSAQRLANGNTLITESDRGYVFEVTPGHDIVWKFANPDVRKDGTRIAIWRMTRVAAESLDFLD